MKKTLISLSIISTLISGISFAEEVQNDNINKNDIATFEEDNIVDVNFKDYSKSKELSLEQLIGKENSNIQKLYFKNSEYFRTSKRLSGDIEFEEIMIEKFKSDIFPLKDEMIKANPETGLDKYNKLINGFYIDTLKTGRPLLADELMYRSGALIDVNFMSDSPKNNPLMAIATATVFDGGDIEYFIKLVNEGADYQKYTSKNRVSLMSLAASVDNYKIVLYLAMKGENPMHLDGLDYYPLDYAARNDASKTVIILTNIISEYKKQIEKR